jgi:hypothetical protein
VLPTRLVPAVFVRQQVKFPRDHLHLRAAEAGLREVLQRDPRREVHAIPASFSRATYADFQAKPRAR